MRRTLRTAASVAAILLTVASTVAVSVAEELPAPGRRDPRIRYVDYKPDEVTLVATQLFTSTQIEFATDENIVFVGVGNPTWDVVPKNNFLFLKPRERQPASNLNVLTEKANGERRSYQLMIGVLPEGAKRDAMFYMIKFQYPSDDQARRRAEHASRSAAEREQQADRLLARDEKNGPRNFGYSVQGEADFEPIEVYDNGKVTTLRFKGVTEMPAIYIEREDGTEELVPKNVVGEAIQVHAIARKLVLRRGDAVLCVFNERFSPEGLEPGTKTTSPVVARVVKANPTPTVTPAVSALAKVAQTVTPVRPTK
jgi:type IV secretion system protein VirB9